MNSLVVKDIDVVQQSEQFVYISHKSGVQLYFSKDALSTEEYEHLERYHDANTTSPQSSAKAESPGAPKAGDSTGEVKDSEVLVPKPDGPATGK